MPETIPNDQDDDADVVQQARTYLNDVGWIRSRRTKRPVDRRGRPIPWYTYPAIEFVRPRLRPTMRVFEFGSGNSTLWWADRVAAVMSVEHNPAWATKMAAQVPPNVTYLHVPLEPNGAYCRAAQSAPDAFDIIVIDGRDRVNCAREGLASLRSDGVIIWDNSDRLKYRPGFEYLEEHGFRRIQFSGHGPINAHSWETSVFYRSENCFGI
jgi:hypothetical protein